MKSQLLILALLVSCAPQAEVNGESLCRAKLTKYTDVDFRLVEEGQVHLPNVRSATSYDFAGGGERFLCIVDQQGIWDLQSGPTVLYQR
jgi:hypothetical protein